MGALQNLGDILRDFRSAHRRRLHMVGDILRCLALLANSVRDRFGDLRQSGNDLRYFHDVGRRAVGGLLNRRYLRGYLLGRAGGLAGQVLDLAGDHGKALAGLAGARRLDGRIQRQQIGLAGDIVDDLDDRPDLVGGIGKPLPRSMNRKVRMADWATMDMPAALKALKRHKPDSALAGLGHSFGGQALGLSGLAPRFLRYMTIAAGSGYLGLTREREKLSRNMNLIGLPVAATLGKLPGWAGMGKDIPFGAFNQWRRWCNSRC